MNSTRPRYQVLKNEDDENRALTTSESNNGDTNVEVSESLMQAPRTLETLDSNQLPSTIITESPPPYTRTGTTQDFNNVNYGNDSPPLYTDIVKLPTYNESENIPEEEIESEEIEPTNRSMFMLWLYGTSHQQDVTEDQAGSHVGFIFSFLISFIFNWVGYLISYCMTSDQSSSYGAISGFGLSLVKWGFVMRHSSWSKDYANNNPWFFYIFILLGWVIFIRGIVAYAQLNHYRQRVRNEQSQNHIM